MKNPSSFIESIENSLNIFRNKSILSNLFIRIFKYYPSTNWKRFFLYDFMPKKQSVPFT